MISRVAEFVGGVLDIYQKGGFSESEMKSLTGKIEENMNAHLDADG